MCEIAFSIPSEVLYDTRQSEEEALRFVHRAAALSCYVQRVALTNINQLELLRKLYGTIIVSQAVMDEIVRESAKYRVHECS